VVAIAVIKHRTQTMKLSPVVASVLNDRYRCWCWRLHKAKARYQSISGAAGYWPFIFFILLGNI